MGLTRIKNWFRRQIVKTNHYLHKDIDEICPYTDVHVLFDYDAADVDELTIRAGDLLSVIIDSSEWWQATNKRTLQTGLVPFNYVSTSSSYFEIGECWYDIDRLESERLLFMPGVEAGYYIIRPSSIRKSVVLSVKILTQENIDVKHYLINIDATKGIYFISENVKFFNLQMLIEYYQKNEIEYGIFLTKARPRAICPPIKLKNCNIDRSLITTQNVLGCGNFGSVLLGQINNFNVAIKVLHENKAKDRLMNESIIMHKLCHPHILRFYGICMESENFPLWLIIEYMDNGSLLDYLYTEAVRNFSANDLIRLIDQIAIGMVYLEASKIVHLDLRAANVLINKSGTLKIADFGLSQMIKSTIKTTTEKTFPVRWSAPEIFKEGYTVSVKADVWSFGILMFEILTFGSVPYTGIEINDILKKVENGYHLPHPRTMLILHRCEDYIYAIMVKCWKLNPDNRPNFADLKEEIVNYIKQKEGFYAAHITNEDND